MKKIGLVSLLALSVCVYPARSETEMNSNKVLNFSVSNKGLTRISVKNDTIKDMFFYPESVKTSLHLHPSGNVFIAPAGLNEPIFLTVILNSGVSQDLKLRFVSKVPKPLILKAKKGQRTLSKEEVERLMAVVLTNNAPRHFKRESPFKRTIKSENTIANEYARFSDGEYSLALFSVKSRVNSSVSVSPDLYIDREEAGKLSVSSLSPNGSAKLVILSKNKEKK